METSTYRITSRRRHLQTDPSSLPPLLRAAAVSGNSPDPLQGVFPVSPDEAVVRINQNWEPLKPPFIRLEINDRESKLPVGAAHVALAARAHREVFDAEKHATIHRGPRMSAEAMG